MARQRTGGYELYPGSSVAGELIEANALLPLSRIPGEALAHERMARQLALQEEKFAEQMRLQERQELLDAAARSEGPVLEFAGAGRTRGGGGGGGRGGGGGGGGGGTPYTVIDETTGTPRTVGVGAPGTWTPPTFAPSVRKTEELERGRAAGLREFLEPERELDALMAGGGAAAAPAGPAPGLGRQDRSTLTAPELVVGDAPWGSPGREVRDVTQAPPAGDVWDYERMAPTEPRAYVSPGDVLGQTVASGLSPEQIAARRERDAAIARRGATREAYVRPATGRAMTAAEVVEAVTPGVEEEKYRADIRRKKPGPGWHVSQGAVPHGGAAKDLAKSIRSEVKSLEKRPAILDELGGRTPNSMVEFVDILTGPLSGDVLSKLKGRGGMRRGQGDLRVAFNDVAAHLQDLRERGDEIGANRMAEAMNNEYKHSEIIRKRFVGGAYSMLRGERSLKGKSDAFVMNLAEQMSRKDTAPLALKFIDRAQAERLKHIGTAVGFAQLRDTRENREKVAEGYAEQRTRPVVERNNAKIESLQVRWMETTDLGQREKIGDEIRALVAESEEEEERVLESNIGRGILMQSTAGGRLLTEEGEGREAAASSRDAEVVSQALAARQEHEAALRDGVVDEVAAARKKLDELDPLARAIDPEYDKGVLAREKAEREEVSADALKLSTENMTEFVGIIAQQRADNRIGKRGADVESEDVEFAEDYIRRMEGQGIPGLRAINNLFYRVATKGPRSSGEDVALILSGLFADAATHPRRGGAQTPAPAPAPAPAPPPPVVTAPPPPVVTAPPARELTARDAGADPGVYNEPWKVEAYRSGLRLLGPDMWAFEDSPPGEFVGEDYVREQFDR